MDIRSLFFITHGSTLPNARIKSIINLQVQVSRQMTFFPLKTGGKGEGILNQVGLALNLSSVLNQNKREKVYISLARYSVKKKKEATTKKFCKM